MYTLQSLMRMNGHQFIDVLKIEFVFATAGSLMADKCINSIETYEFETLKDLLIAYKGRPLPFGQLQIEIHAWLSHFQQTSKLMSWWESLEDAGLRPFMNEPNLV